LICHAWQETDGGIDLVRRCMCILEMRAKK
jgi:hypothetical protein